MIYFNFLFDYFYHNIINTFLKRQKNQSFLIDLIINIALVRRFLLLEQVSGIEPPSQPWQGRVLADVLHLHNLEGLVGFEPTIRELQSHALPLGYRPKYLFRIIIITKKFFFYNIIFKKTRFNSRFF